MTKDMKEIIATHHENYDGTDFPKGLSIKSLKQECHKKMGSHC